MVVVVGMSIVPASSGTLVVVPDSSVDAVAVVASAEDVLDEIAEAVWLPLTEEVKELGLSRFVCDVLRLVSGSFVI